MWTKILCSLMLLSPAIANGKLITTSLKFDFARPHDGQVLNLESYEKKLSDKLELYKAKQYKVCKNRKKIPKKMPERLQVWWTYLSLNCANKYFKNKNYLRPYIKSQLDQLDQYKGDKSYLNMNLAQIVIKLAGSKNYIISNIEKDFLIRVEDVLPNKLRAKFYSFIASRFKKTKEFHLAAQYHYKAYQFDDQPMYATRLKTLLNEQKELRSSYSQFYNNFGLIKPQKKTSYNSFYRKKGSLAKVKEGVRLLNANQSAKYKIISKIYHILKNRVKPNLKSKWSKAILNCHDQCLVKLAQRFYQAHKYEMAYAYASVVFERKPSPSSAIAMGLASLQLGEYSKATNHFKQARKLSEFKSKYYFESTFRLGLVYFRLKKYKDAITTLQNLEGYKELNKFNLQTTYWLWRSLQEVDDKKAKVVQNRLIKLYPLTYYGLLANYQKNNKKLVLPTNIHVFQKDMKWNSKQIISWSNYKDFLKAQMYSLAMKELKILFDTDNDQEAVLFSYYSSLAADHFSAIKTMNVIWDKNPYINFTKNTTKLTLPTEYDAIVNSYSTKYNLENNLVRSLIKQESSYRLNAVSSSNAMGLMQLVPITIKDSAGYLKINKKNARRDVFQPELNIKMGTSYLFRMVRAFKGHVPLALAAYNAGIGNMRRWMKNRPDDLVPLAAKGSSSVRDEIWIDELPWAETSFYVKAILRNLVLYRFYYDGVSDIPEPVWSIEEPVTATNKPSSLIEVYLAQLADTLFFWKE